MPPKIPAKATTALNDAILAAATGHIDTPVKDIEELIAKYPTWTLPRQKLSEIYYKADRKQEAVKTLEGAIAIDSASQTQQLFTIGRLYEQTSQPALAIKAYNAVIRLDSTHIELKQKSMTSRDALEKKRNLWANKNEIEFTPMPADINTPNNEYLGRWTLDGKEFIFTRRFNDQENILLATFEGNKVLGVEDFSFNTGGNEAAQTISPDGKYLVFTSCARPDGLGGCDLYFSLQKDGTWTKPVNMGSPINTPSWESQPCFGLDGQTIYFSSNRAGGFGGSDIWVVRLQHNGKWSPPINAGKEINTSDNEESPFIHFDGRTMYFMRDGKAGLGGFDLYFSRLAIDGHWQTPENMGAPINTGSDEGAFSLHPNGKTAIITRMTDLQKNDLFEFQLPAAFVSAPVQALEVKVIDEDTKKPLRAKLEIFEISGRDTIRESQWSDEIGMITLSLERNKSYGVISAADGYMMHSVNLQPDTSAVRELVMMMTPINAAVDKTIVLENVFFSTGSSVILPASGPELNRLYQTLKGNAQMKIDIRGHTDNVGTDDDNLQLSEARSKSVYQYLIERGIQAERLSYRGFGETHPIATNDTEEGRRQNRRTEFFIISN